MGESVGDGNKNNSWYPLPHFFPNIFHPLQLNLLWMPPLHLSKKTSHSQKAPGMVLFGNTLYPLDRNRLPELFCYLNESNNVAVKFFQFFCRNPQLIVYFAPDILNIKFTDIVCLNSKLCNKARA